MRFRSIISVLALASAVSAVVACDTEKKAGDAYVAATGSEPAQVRGAFDIDVTGTKIVDVAIPTDTGVASARFASIKPGFAGIVTGVSTFARTRSGTLAGSVKVAGKTAVSSLTFGIDSTKAMTLIADSLQFSATDSIDVYLATTAGGTVKQGHVILKLKPRY